MTNNPDESLSTEERREHILSYLSKHDRGYVADLSQLLGVSEVTVRKDLDFLEGQGFLTRIHGGALASGRGRLELHFGAREQQNLDEKRRIAQSAALLIQSGQRIFLDASTTALQVARMIKDREDLIVVTNGLYTAMELVFCEGITTMVLGGTVRPRSSSLVGNLNTDLLRRLRVDLGIFGAYSVTAKDGLMETDIDEATLKQSVVNVSNKVVGIADSSKFGTTSFSVFALPEEIDLLITDTKAPPEIVESLLAQEVQVELV